MKKIASAEKANSEPKHLVLDHLISTATPAERSELIAATSSKRCDVHRAHAA